VILAREPKWASGPFFDHGGCARGLKKPDAAPIPLFFRDQKWQFFGLDLIFEMLLRI
jgi:hypothetical protein